MSRRGESGGGGEKFQKYSNMNQTEIATPHFGGQTNADEKNVLRNGKLC